MQNLQQVCRRRRGGSNAPAGGPHEADMQSTFERTNSRNFFPTPAPTIPADTIRLARLADARQISDLVERSSLAATDGADERKEARGLLEAVSESLEKAIRN